MNKTPMSRLLTIVAMLAVVSSAASVVASPVKSNWTCNTIVEARVPENRTDSPIVWTQLSCHGETPYLFNTNLQSTVNVIEVDLSHPGLAVSPLSADPNPGVQSLSEIMDRGNNETNSSTTWLAGVNGGYFFRTDEGAHWFDDVCFGKTYAEATQPANISEPTHGVGDCVSVRDGKLLSSNCGLFGNSQPPVMVFPEQSRGTESKIHVLKQNERPSPSQWYNAIGSGPNLVSTDPKTGRAFIDVRGFNLNEFSITANTAVGLRQSRTHPTGKDLVMVTFDGHDGCDFLPQPVRCGINLIPMAAFMLDYLNVTEAMSMDQGGSTTMVVEGQGHGGLVSCTSKHPPCEASGERKIFNGLFVGLKN